MCAFLNYVLQKNSRNSRRTLVMCHVNKKTHAKNFQKYAIVEKNIQDSNSKKEP